jgi:hypothetical protein
MLYLIAPSPARVGPGGRAVAAGVVLAIVAMWYGLLTSLPGKQGAPIAVGLPTVTDGILRLAVVLVLGGLVTGLLLRDVATVPPTLPERPRDVPPSA